MYFSIEESGCSFSFYFVTLGTEIQGKVCLAAESYREGFWREGFCVTELATAQG